MKDLLEPNQNGSLVGVFHGLIRVSAGVWKVPSSTHTADSYLVFVRSLRPAEFRCRCDGFFYRGDCKHGPQALAAESAYNQAHPTVRRAERKRGKERADGR